MCIELNLVADAFIIDSDDGGVENDFVADHSFAVDSLEDAFGVLLFDAHFVFEVRVVEGVEPVVSGDEEVNAGHDVSGVFEGFFYF